LGRTVNSIVAVRLSAFAGASSANRENPAFVDAVEAFNRGEFDHALGQLNHNEALVSNISEEYLEIQNLRALVLIAKGAIEEAKAVADSIITTAQQLEDEHRLGLGEILLSSVNQELGHPRYAMDLALRALGRLRSVGTTSELARATLQLGATRTMIGDLEDARVDFETSVALAKMSGDLLTEGLALTRLGFCFVCQTELLHAAHAYTQAVERFAAIGSSWRRDRALFGLAVLRLKQGDVQDAAQLISELELRYAAESQGWRYARIRLLRGWCEVLQGNVDSALAFLRAAVESFGALNAQRDMALCQEFIGDALAIRGETEAALRAYETAETLGRMVSTHSDVVVEAIRKSGELLVEEGQFREALTKARSAHRLTRRYTDRLEIEATRRLRAMIKIRRGKVQRGFALLSDAWEGFIRIGAAGESRRTAKLYWEGVKAGVLPIAPWLSQPDEEAGGSKLPSEGASEEVGRAARSSRKATRQTEAGASGIISQDTRILTAFQTCLRAAPLDLPVLVLGETGTGKELFATLAHEKSGRKGTLLAINCAALPADILDAELFGHAKGAYTGADRDRPGLIEAASGGTLFLDEIGEMSLAVQGRLLRAIEAKEIRRLGENHARKVTTRFVGATHRDLNQMVKDGKFRADLFFRLRGIVVSLPPLRERPEDILLLADYFLRREASRIGREFQLTKDAREKMRSHPWPGNVRELKSVIERAAAMCESGELIAADDLGIDWIQGSGSLAEHLESEERRSLLAILESVDWNQSKAARQLKIKRTTLLGRLTRLGIERPRKK
jgi:DNA-binding NtrC family response regulator/predicted negative regulator of RcsB-dependent stress response